MQRRDFLKSSAAFAAIGALAQDLRADAAAPAARQHYELRAYRLRMGPKQKLFDDFFRDAAIPAWNRAGIAPVGVFSVMVGPDSPTMYVLLPAPSFDALEAAEEKVLTDAQYLSAGADFLNAAAGDAAFVRVESSLLRAFAAMSKLEVPAGKPRLYELRTYESASEKIGLKKIEMFNSGEIDIFRRNGLRPVFFGQALVGARLPCLTYMLAFADLAERTKNWAAFVADPEWKRLSGLPEYAQTVSNISNIFLQPAAYSQI